MTPILFKRINMHRGILSKNKCLLEQNINLIRENSNLKKYILGDNEMNLTNYKQWINLANHLTAWEPRTEVIAKMIQPNSSIIEFGAGRQALLKYIDKSCAYQPSDIVDRGDNTIIIDLNTDNLPNLSKYDYAVFSGVLEYIQDVPRVVKWLNTFVNNVVMSYLVEEGKGEEVTQERRGHGWLNEYSDSEIIDLFNKNNFTLQDKSEWIDPIPGTNSGWKHIIYSFKNMDLCQDQKNT